MDEQLARAFQGQVALEQASAQAYLQMAAWAELRDLTGIAGWLRAQSDEETGHARRFVDFLLDRDVQVRLQALAAPQADFDSVVTLFEAALEHERRVTREIGELYAAAQASGDYASLPLLSWFLAEQVEEEATVHTILGRLQMVQGDPSSVLLLDRELSGRRAAPSPGPAA